MRADAEGVRSEKEREVNRGAQRSYLLPQPNGASPLRWPGAFKPPSSSLLAFPHDNSLYCPASFNSTRARDAVPNDDDRNLIARPALLVRLQPSAALTTIHLHLSRVPRAGRITATPTLVSRAEH